MRNGLRLRLDRSQDAVIACACLHNIAKRSNLSFGDHEEMHVIEDNAGQMLSENMYEYAGAPTLGGTVTRNQIVQHHFM